MGSSSRVTRLQLLKSLALFMTIVFSRSQLLEVENWWGYEDQQVFCTAFGFVTYERYLPYLKPDVDNAYDCFKTCFDTAKTARKGVYVTRDSGYSTIMLYYPPHKTHRNWWQNDAITSVKVNPCAKVTLWEHGDKTGMVKRYDAYNSHGVIQEDYSVTSKDFNDKASKYELGIQISKPFCRAVHDNKNGDGKLCTHWAFDPTRNRADKCYLYNSDQLRIPGYTRYKDVQGSFSGHTNCGAELSRIYLDVANSTGCMSNLHALTSSSFHTVDKTLYYAKSCRTMCLAQRACAMFKHDAVNKKCYLYDSANAAAVRLKVYPELSPREYTGTRVCHTCPHFFYLPAGQDGGCQLCEKGYYCPGGIDRIMCPEEHYCPKGSRAPKPCDIQKKQFCPTEGMDKPYTECPETKHGDRCQFDVRCITGTSRGVCNKDTCFGFDGNGTCSGCSIRTSGKICEHNVCANSRLGSELTARFSELTSFDFGRYEAENVRTEQTWTSQGPSLKVQFRPISTDIRSYTASARKDGAVVASKNLVASPDCESLATEEIIFPELRQDLGKTALVCVKGFWKTETQSLTGGSWDNPEPDTAKDRVEPETCVVHTMLFQTHIKFVVSDRSNTLQIPARVVLRIGDTLHEFYSELGEITASILLPPGVATGAFMPMVIENATGKPGVETDMKICLSQPVDGATCEPLQELPYDNNGDLRVQHQETPAQTFYVFDTAAVVISGKIRFQAYGGASCLVHKVEVEARSKRDETVLATATTGADGVFKLSLPKNSLVQLKFSYLNHTIVPDNHAASEAIVSPRGLRVDSPISDLQFLDIDTRRLSFTAAVTECMYSIRGFELQLKGCGGVVSIIKDKDEFGNTLMVQLPAHAFEYNMEFTNGVNEADTSSVKKDYEFVHPSDSEVNLTVDNQDLQFIYHPQPVVEMSVMRGSYDDEESRFNDGFFPREDCPGKQPTHFALQSNAVATFFYNVYQEVDKVSPEVGTFICRKMPTGSQIRVTENLGVQGARCSTTRDFCWYNLTVGEFQDVNYSFATVEAPVGQASERTTTWHVDYRIRNSAVWNEASSESGAKPVSQRNYTVILGNRDLTSNTLVSFFAEGQDHIPLFYIYSPPDDGQSSQTVSLTLSVTTTKEVYENKNIEAGGGISAGLKTTASANICIPFSGCPIKVVDTSIEASAGGSSFLTETLSFTDTVQSTVRSNSIEVTAKGDDTVLVLGTSGTFVKSELVSFKDSGCSLGSRASITWGSISESLLFKDRRTIRSDIQKLEETKAVHTPRLTDGSLSQEERDDSLALVISSNNSIAHWNALIRHWDDDKLGARDNPVNLLSAIPDRTSGGIVNRLTYSSQAITLTKVKELSDSSVLDYQSTTKVHNTNLDTSFELLFGSGTLVGVTGSAFAEVTTVSESTFIKTKEIGNEMSISATMIKGPGEEVCVDVYESPYSGTFLFEVCGGETKCPHVQGTDPLQGFLLSIEERPQGILSRDDGKFVLVVTPQPELNAGDELDITILLEAQTSGSPVTYHVGGLTGQALSTPFTTTLMGGSPEFRFNIFFQRSASTVQQTTVSGRVESSCDSSIGETFRFETRWASSCPAVGWGGELTDPQSHFKITQKNPDLRLTALSFNTNWAESNGIKVDVRLWIRLFEPATSAWTKVDNKYLRLKADSDASSSFIDNLDPNGRSTLFISAETDIFRDGQRYLFELRAVCTNDNGNMVGSTRSGARLGIIDMNGPSLISQTSTAKIKAAVAEFPVARMLFNEAIDCSNPNLRSRVFAVNTTKVEGRSSVYCTSDMHQLTVVLKLESEVEASLWSGTRMEIEVLGVQDLHGNLFGVNGRLSLSSRLLQEANKISLDINGPGIPLSLGFQNRSWGVFTAQEIEAQLTTQMELILPSAYVHGSTHFINDDLPSPSSVVDSGAVLGGAIGGSVVGLLVLAVLAYAYAKQLLPFQKEKAEPPSEVVEDEMIKVEL